MRIAMRTATTRTFIIRFKILHLLSLFSEFSRKLISGIADSRKPLAPVLSLPERERTGASRMARECFPRRFGE